MIHTEAVIKSSAFKIYFFKKILSLSDLENQGGYKTRSFFLNVNIKGAL